MLQNYQNLPDDRWKNVHLWLFDLQQAFKADFNCDVMFLLDCNPSFATYTAQALIASDRVIVPCTADGSSARAIDNLAQLLYAEKIPSIYKKANFYQKAKDFGLELPKIHSIILNRSTVNRDKPASAFAAMYNKIKERVNYLKGSRPDDNKAPLDRYNKALSKIVNMHTNKHYLEVNMKIKKILCLMLLSIGLTLSACQNSESSSSPNVNKIGNFVFNGVPSSINIGEEMNTVQLTATSSDQNFNITPTIKSSNLESLTVDSSPLSLMEKINLLQ